MVPVVVLFVLPTCWINVSQSKTVLTLNCTALCASSALLIRESFADLGVNGTDREFQQFGTWASRIPTGGNVLVPPAHNSAAFSRFTPIQPSYLAVDQSTAVFFFAATAIGVKRRSEVPMPVFDPNWCLLTSGAILGSTEGERGSARWWLTEAKLRRICGDPQLGFVVSRTNLRLDPMPRSSVGPLKDWYLYDGRRFRAANPAI